MRSKIIKKAYKRDDFKLTSHNFLLCISPGGNEKAPLDEGANHVLARIVQEG